MNKRLKGKYEHLLSSLENLGDLAVAFSGGVDSSFLLYAAREALGHKVLALTVKTPYIPDWEVEEAKNTAKALGVKHRLFDLQVPDPILQNPRNRCYLCKSTLFRMLKDFSVKEGYRNLADGSNADDAGEHRPGMKALRELQVLSPLLETGLTKADIRNASRELGLPTWEKPAYACLLTRIPYDTRITHEMLRRIERSETFLREIGILAVRVRTHENLARIETEPKYIDKIFQDRLYDKISKGLRSFGFSFVTLDLEGYRTGGIDVTLQT